MCLYAALETVTNCDILCDVLRIVLFLDEGDNQIVAATTMNNWTICDVYTNTPLWLAQSLHNTTC